jgi:hypothetical protein
MRMVNGCDTTSIVGIALVFLLLQDRGEKRHSGVMATASQQVSTASDG